DIPQDLADFLRDYKENDDNGGTAASDNHPGNFNEIPLPTDRDQVLGEDVGGRPYTDEELSSIEQLTAGQKLGAMLIGMFNTLLRMDPKDIGIKKSHGASAQLINVQAIQTAQSHPGCATNAIGRSTATRSSRDLSAGDKTTQPRYSRTPAR